MQLINESKLNNGFLLDTYYIFVFWDFFSDQSQQYSWHFCVNLNISANSFVDIQKYPPKLHPDILQ